MFKPSIRRRHMGGKPAAKRAQTNARPVRAALTKSANLNIDGDQLAMGCTLRDLSLGGARLSVAMPNEVPNEILIMCETMDLMARARVVWRKKNEIGLRFIRRGKWGQEAIFRMEQARSYKAKQKADEEERLKAPPSFTSQHHVNGQIAHFKTMGLDDTLDYSADQLKRRYRVLAMKAHPDGGGCAEDFQKLTNAYQALSSIIAS